VRAERRGILLFCCVFIFVFCASSSIASKNNLALVTAMLGTGAPHPRDMRAEARGAGWYRRPAVSGSTAIALAQDAAHGGGGCTSDGLATEIAGYLRALLGS
jgi:hypothetical protein